MTSSARLLLGVPEEQLRDLAEAEDAARHRQLPRRERVAQARYREHRLRGWWIQLLSTSQACVCESR